jgi:hypothetical protein
MSWSDGWKIDQAQEKAEVDKLRTRARKSLPSLDWLCKHLRDNRPCAEQPGSACAWPTAALARF